jgi:hypothetical protein
LFARSNKLRADDPIFSKQFKDKDATSQFEIFQSRDTFAARAKPPY